MKSKQQFTFEGQREDENIVAIWRQHPWVMIKIVLLIVAIFTITFLPMLLPGGFTGVKLAIGGTVAIALLGLGQLYIWWNTVYILSTQRVIGSDQSKMLTREVSEVPLENIQNIVHIKQGVGSMLFDYGTVKLRTAGSKIAMRLKNVEHPLQVQQKITDTSRNLRSKSN